MPTEQLTIMASSFTEIKNSVVSAVGVIAPIAIIILGIIIIWTFAANFFKRIGR
jgi:type II secretory pathway component PulF